MAIKPFGKGLMLEILRHADEIRPADALFKEIAEVKVDKEALDLAKELIKRKSGKFEPEQFKDEYSGSRVGADPRQDREPRAGDHDRRARHRQGDQHHGRAEEERAAGQGHCRRQDRAKRGATRGHGKKTAKGAPKRKSA